MDDRVLPPISKSVTPWSADEQPDPADIDLDVGRPLDMDGPVL